MSLNECEFVKSNRTVADEAARWFVRLQESSATPDTFREWQQWLNADPEHRRTYEEIESTALRVRRVRVIPPLPLPQELEHDTYDGSMSIREWKRTTGASDQSSQGTTLHWRRPTTRLTWQWSRLGIAASLLLLALWGGWFLLRPNSHMQPSQMFQTGPGQRQVVMLPEGSRVTLDADSVLEVNFAAHRRSLVLRHGEAFFQVAKDRERPFIVQTATAEVTAVGTAFNVRLSDDRTVVAVTEGKVEFVATPNKDTPTLMNAARATSTRVTRSHATLVAEVSAGEAVSYVEDGRLQTLPDQSTPLATSWLDGRRQYRDEPLRYVLTDIDRYMGQRIRLGDTAAGELRFTGTLNLQNSTAWLQGLSMALPVTLSQDSDGTVVIQRK